MRYIDMPLGLDLKRIEVDNSDLALTDKRILGNLAFQIFLIRQFEETLLRLASDGCIHGPVHTSIGHEACASGIMSVLDVNDKIASTHRAHHHYLTKAVSYYQKGFDATAEIPENIQHEVTTLMGEVMGLGIGCCGGRGGSMHLRNPGIGVIGTNAIVAGGVPPATGEAFASKYRNDGSVVVCFLGDGAINQGAFHEAANLAGIWKLPIIYFVENNLYAVATSIKSSTATEDLAIKAASYGLAGRVVDGMDPIAVIGAAKDALEYCRSGKGAVLLEAKCYRYFHHAGSIEGSNFRYRSKEEEERWRGLDPYHIFSKKLVDCKIFSQDQINDIKAKAAAVVQSSVEYCTTKEDDKFYVKRQLLPKPESIYIGLKSDNSEFDGIVFHEEEDFSDFREITYSDAIASVTKRWLEKDNEVFVLGEEVANFGGGPYGATKGLPGIYPNRILNTPISESGFTGLAAGAAMSGMKPIVEIMFPDFALVAADQLFNQIGKLRHIYNNTADMPIVVRTRIAIGCGYGGQHSMDPIGLYSLFSGWTILAPSSSADYIGLFNSAMTSRNPVLIIEHQGLYAKKFQIPSDDFDYRIPIGKGKIIRSGDNITVLCYSSTVDLSSRAAESLALDGVDAEVIDLRTLSPNDIDYTLIGDSLKKTGMMVIVEQAPKSHSIGSKIVEQCQKEFFDYLDGPIETISGLDIPNPVSEKLETAALPSIESVKKKIASAAARIL